MRPLLAPRPPQPDRTARRLARAASIPDLRAIARRRTPRPVFDYADGAAEREIGLRRSREAFARVELIPRALEDVSAVDTSTEILGRRAELPLAFAPTGYTRLFHHEGERAVARVAERAGIPTGLSTVGTTSIEGSPPRRAKARKWFQVYVLYDRDATADLVARAEAAGFEALILTVDVLRGRLAVARRPQSADLPAQLQGAGRHRAAARHGGPTCSRPSRCATPR